MNSDIQIPSLSDLRKYLRRVLPSKSDDREHVVYWLHDSSCKDPVWDGYVGVTIGYRELARFQEHMRSGKFPTDVKMTILSRGFAETCYLYEAVLRPHAHIGWNVAAGGARGNKSGIPKSEETKAKIGSANRGNKRPDLAERNRKHAGQKRVNYVRRVEYNSNRIQFFCVGCQERSAPSHLLNSHRSCWKKYQEQL